MEKYTLDIFLSTLVVERVINKMHKDSILEISDMASSARICLLLMLDDYQSWES